MHVKCHCVLGTQDRKGTWSRSLRGSGPDRAALTEGQRSLDIRHLWLGQLLEIVVVGLGVSGWLLVTTSWLASLESIWHVPNRDGMVSGVLCTTTWVLLQEGKWGR